MGYNYEKEKIFREIVEKLIIFSGEIDNVYDLYQQVYGKIDTNEVSELTESLSLFFEQVRESRGVSLLHLDTETYIYQVDKRYKNDLINVTKVIEMISAEDFEKLCALFLKEIVKCEAVNATQRSHDQGIDFVGYKKYVKCLTTEEQNDNLLYVIGQAKHYQNQRVETSYFSSYAYVLCKNAAIIAIDRLSLVLNLVFSDMFDGMRQSDILKEIRKVKRIS